MGIFTKLKDFVGLSEAQEYEYEYDEASSREYQDIYQEDNGAIAPEPEEPQARRTRERPTALRATSENMSNVIGMPGAANGLSQVMVMEPTETCNMRLPAPAFLHPGDISAIASKSVV